MDKKSSPKISIIVPVYNVEEYLPRCLDSLLAQSYENIEIILVDDGSQDCSGEICDTYAALDPRVCVIHKENGGVSLSRNIALDKANGEIIAFADSDDWVEENWIERLLQPFLEQDDMDVSICGWYRHEDDVIKLYGDRYPSGTIDGCQAFRIAVRGAGFDGYLWNKMFRASLIKDLRFREDIAICEDLLFTCQVFMRSKKIECISSPLYHYMIRPNSALRSYTLRRESELIARDSIVHLVEHDDELYRLALFIYVQSALTYVYKAQKYGVGLENSAKKIYRSTKPFILQALLQKSVGLKARLKVLAMYISPTVSMDIWFMIKKLFGIEYTKPTDR